jgi:hypothetical protein
MTVQFEMKLYNNQRNAQVFLFISLFASVLLVSGFLQAYLQEALCTVPTWPGRWLHTEETRPLPNLYLAASEDGLKESPKHVRQK